MLWVGEMVELNALGLFANGPLRLRYHWPNIFEHFLVLSGQEGCGISAQN